MVSFNNKVSHKRPKWVKSISTYFTGMLILFFLGFPAVAVTEKGHTAIVENPLEKNKLLRKPEKQNDEKGEDFSVPPPLVYQGLFPCQACHRRDVRGVSSELEKGNSFLGKYIRKPNPEPRMLVKMHRNIKLQHAEWHWCLNCHDTDERNYLRLITGEKIPFEKSYRLCGQCHGSIYRDWKIGIHGRRVGNWEGKKLYLLCSHCHDPHSPKFRKLPAEAPPEFPSYGRWDTVAQDVD